MFGKIVRYYNSSGTGNAPAVVTVDHGDGTLDMVGFNSAAGPVPAASKLTSVPKKTTEDSTHVWEEIV